MAAALLSATLFGAPAALPLRAVAADADTQRAREAFREGQKHYNLGEFSDALERFKEAYRLKPDPVLLYNIGQCQWKMGDLKAAVHSYRAYLRGAGDVANRPEVEARIAELEQKIRDREAAAAQPKEPVGLPSAAPVPAAPPPGFTVVEVSPPPAPAAPHESSLAHQWWFWTAIGVAAVAGVVTAVLVTRDPTDVPSTTLGSKGAFGR
jgi:tetratricopeptide (TPR) repeat protein